MQELRRWWKANRANGSRGNFAASSKRHFLPTTSNSCNTNQSSFVRSSSGKVTWPVVMSPTDWRRPSPRFPINSTLPWWRRRGDTTRYAPVGWRPPSDSKQLLFTGYLRHGKFWTAHGNFKPGKRLDPTIIEIYCYGEMWETRYRKKSKLMIA